MRTVITGLGVISPLGNNVADFWRSLCEGRSGIAPITKFDSEPFAFRQAGEVRDFVLPASLASVCGEKVDLATAYALAAIGQAVADAGFEDGDDRLTGTVLGTNFGGIASGEGVMASLCDGERVEASRFTEFCSETAVDHAAACWGLNGPRAVLSLSCSSGTAALGYARELIRAGRADAVITCGYDMLSRYAWSGLSSLRTMTGDRVRPFDRQRDGTIFSEGACAVVVESLSSAEQRDVSVYAELCGAATNNNAFHLTAPSKGGAGSADVMEAALEDAGLSCASVDHVNAHGQRQSLTTARRQRR